MNKGNNIKTRSIGTIVIKTVVKNYSKQIEGLLYNNSTQDTIFFFQDFR